MITTDAFLLQSGYIKAEALQNKIYLQALDKKQVLSQMMADLAKGHIVKYGFDNFVKEMIDKSLELYPNNMFAQMIKSDLRTANFFYVQRQVRIPLKDIHKYPRLNALFSKMHQQYALIDKLGFEKMPIEDYKKWLASLSQVKKQQNNQVKKLKVNNTIEIKR